MDGETKRRILERRYSRQTTKNLARLLRVAHEEGPEASLAELKRMFGLEQASGEPQKDSAMPATS
jgi:hypothetical protein